MAILASYFFPVRISYVTIFIFVCLGVGFFTAGIVMILSIKKHFVEFYDKVSCALWTATFLLAVPMFLRAVNWLLQNFSKSYLKFYNDNIIYTNACYSLLTTIFPVCAQMASLIFGLLN